jgi:hypothetical protein
VSSWTVIRTGSRPKCLRRCNEVRRRANLVLQVFIGLIHDHGIDADPCHHGEMLRRTVVDSDLHQVNLAYLPAEGDLDGVCFLKWKIEVSSQQITGAGRHQAERNPGMGENVGYVADGAVPTSTNDKINLLRDGLSGHGAAWIIDRSLEPQRVHPALALEAVLLLGRETSR